MLGLLDVQWSLNFTRFHCDAIMGQMLYQFQGNQQDYFSDDTFRGRSLVSSALYYEVTPPDTFPLRYIFGGVTLVAMISMRLQFDAKEPVGFDKTKVECFNCHNTGHFAIECRSKGNQESRRRDAGNTGYKAKDNGRRPGKQEEPKALVTIDGEGSDTEVTSCSKECVESYAKLKKLYDTQREQLGDASIEIKAYTLALAKYESDSDDENVIKPSKEQEKPSFAFVNIVKHVKTPRKTVKEQNTCSPSPKVNKRDWNSLMSKKLGLGYGFTKKACFVCGSFSHLIRDCDFHEKRMAKQVELNKKKGNGTGQGENKPVWNNVQRLNHQNKFVPKVVLTKTGIFLVNTAKQNPSSQTAETSTDRKVNTARPIVNEIRQRNNFYKSHSPIRRPFKKSIAPKANFTNHKVNTAGDKTVSAVRGYRETAVKASAGCNWRPKRHYWTKVSKFNSGSNSNKNVNFKDPLGRPKSTMAWVPKRN
ncbi:ribonuclease H-like domain-containing protein [Tanacetum coccineum]